MKKVFSFSGPHTLLKEEKYDLHSEQVSVNNMLTFLSLFHIH